VNTYRIFERTEASMLANGDSTQFYCNRLQWQAEAYSSRSLKNKPNSCRRPAVMTPPS
jgi:hypothetical protein